MNHLAASLMVLGGLAGCAFEVPLGEHDGGSSCGTFGAAGLALDPAFGDCGRVRLDVGQVENVAWGVQGMTLDLQGRVVIAGRGGRAGAFDFTAVRLLDDGAPDPTFGVAGVATLDVGTPDDAAQAVLVEPGGAVVLVGGGNSATGDAPSSIFARLTATGLADSSFGAGGFIVADVGASRGVCNTVVRRAADGVLICGGHGWDVFPGPTNLQLLARHADGSPDSFFGVASRAAIDFVGGDEFGGAILAEGDHFFVPTSAWTGASFDFALVRLKELGFADATFSDARGVPGQASLDVEGGADGCVAVLPDQGGAICVGTGTMGGQLGGLLVRFTAQGAVDATFGSAGRAPLPQWTAVNAVLPLAGGNFLIGGALRGSGTNTLLAIQEFTAAGVALGEPSTLEVSAEGDEVRALALDPQGRLLVFGVAGQGSGDNDFFLARLAPPGDPGARRLGVAGACSTAPAALWAVPWLLLLFRRRPRQR